MNSIMFVDDATPADAARLGGLLDPARFAAHRLRPRYQPGYTFAALAGERLLGTAYLAHERRRIGAAVLNVAHVTLQADAALQQRLIAQAVSVAAEAGLPWLQVVRPAPAEPLPGLAVCGLQYRLDLAALTGASARLRPATPDDIADLVALNAALAATVPLAHERTAADWRWLTTTQGETLFVLEDERARIAGYGITCAPDTFREAYAADAAVGRVLLKALAEQGHRIGRLGPSHPLTHGALVHGGQLDAQAAAPSGQIVEWGVIDMAEALRELAAELGRRIGRSRYAGWQGRVALETGGRRVELACAMDSVQVEPHPRAMPDVAVQRIALEALPQVLLGYRTVADLRASRMLQCAESDFGLIDSLLPLLYTPAGC